MIAVIGPRDSGKTSLIASVYDLFQEGPVGDIRFSRSRTLHAFEQTCHDARAASRRGVPHMNRTPIGDVRFYHVEIGCGEAEERLSLLLGDRAGEEYLAAADDVAVVPSFTEVIRADTLTVLVDGARLLESGGRHNLRIGIIMMLQGLHDGGGLSPASRLAVVTPSWMRFVAAILPDGCRPISRSCSVNSNVCSGPRCRKLKPSKLQRHQGPTTCPEAPACRSCWRFGSNHRRLRERQRRPIRPPADRSFACDRTMS